MLKNTRTGLTKSNELNAACRVLLSLHFVYAAGADSISELSTFAKDILSQVSNVPDIARLELERDCGARAVSTAMLVLGLDPNFEMIEKQLMIDSAGTSLKRVSEVADRQGLRSLGAHLEPEQLSRLQCPVILHVKSDFEDEEANHFVLYVRGRPRESVCIIDAPFVHWHSLDRLKQFWSGDCLLLNFVDSDLKKINPASSHSGLYYLGFALVVLSLGLIVVRRRCVRIVSAR